MPRLQPAQRALPYAHDADEPGAGTSRAAAVAIAPDVVRLRERYYRWLTRRGSRGATDLEAAAALGVERTTVIPRRSELKDAVMFSGEKRARVVRGRLCSSKVWIAREASCG
jgi:hypothetical protein